MTCDAAGTRGGRVLCARRALCANVGTRLALALSLNCFAAVTQAQTATTGRSVESGRPALAIGHSQSGSKTVLHTVEPGDTVSAISEILEGPRRWAAIRDANPGLQIDHIYPGRVLNLPADRLRGRPTTARVAEIVGGGTVDGVPLVVGMQISAGQTLRVVKQGFVTFTLASGARVRLSGGSAVTFARLDEVPSVSATREVIRIDEGRIETAAPTLRGPGARFQISTPTAIAAVRGTTFRVGVGEKDGAMTTEVIEGTVAVAPGGSKAAQSRTRPVREFSGVLAEPGRPLSPPRLLTAPPELLNVPLRFERGIVAFSTPLPDPRVRLRVQIAADPAFERVVAEDIFAGGAIAFPAIRTGTYYLAARAIRSDGLEGLDAIRTITVGGQPEPPRIIGPPANSRIDGGAVRIELATARDASRYVLQIASVGAGTATDFTAPAFEQTVSVTAMEMSIAPGDYAFRLASIDVIGDRSAYGEPVPFTMVSLPPDGRSDEATPVVIDARPPGPPPPSLPPPTVEWWLLLLLLIPFL